MDRKKDISDSHIAIKNISVEHKDLVNTSNKINTVLPLK